ncbi:MAG: tRNA (adenosine(37)-N6)-dimethylallyltransferase MiaA [Flavobacteriales bacterium]|nr:tRNA (adenosine(37)-N6)-dimethylallyltransferase MiaA [Flavobacteriales bacterium]|tara:strand:- start:47697 stop:48623 length:927 start_codon:yes stop_codon:yes gene_type:complete
MKNITKSTYLKDKKVIFIVGPTAIGKTKVSIDLAKMLNTEIISSDSRQFYKELKIGSAPPSKEELSQVKHHFIHNLSVKDDYNAGQFEIDAMNLIQKLHKIHDSIIVVGGSGLYVDAICKGLDTFPKISKETRKNINDEYNRKGLTWLQKKIKKIDPELYSSNEIKNPQRLIRAVEVFEESGEILSSLKSYKIKKRPFKIIKIGLNTERKKLYNNINKRVDTMIEEGLLQEVKSLLKFKKNNALQTVGYKEIFLYLNNECTLQKAIENIKQNTRRYAKRQLTWFNKDKEISWFEPQQIKEIEKFIAKL